MLQSFLADVFTLPASNISTLMMLLKATLILVTALGITVTMRRASAGARHLVWLVTLGTLLLVPALTAWSPLRVAILPPAKAVASRSTASVTPTPAPAAINETPVINETSASIARNQNVAPPTPASRGIFARIGELSGFSALLAIWGAIVLALAGWLAYGALTVRGIVRRARPLDTPDWLTPLYEVSDRLSIEDAPRLLRSEDAKMPFACGVLHPTIVLPAECDNWTQDRRLAVLLHELAHVRRHDLIGHTLGRLACAIYWFHPLVWTAAKQLRSESERACDDLALSCGARPSDYAEHLLDIVTSVRHDATPAVALAMARRKEFEGRMLAILDPELRHSSPSRWQSAGLIASLAVVALVVGAAAPAQRAAPLVRAVLVPGTKHSEIALAPAPEVKEPTTSKLEQNPPQKSAPAYPNSGTPGVTSTATNTLQQIVQNTVQSASKVVSTAITNAVSDKSIEKAVDKGMDNAAAALVDKSSKGLLSYLGNKAVNAQGKDDRPVLLANILRTDADPDLRRIAAWGLAEYNESSVGTDALVNAVRRDANASVREMAAWALGEGGDGNGAAIDALVTAFRSDADVKVRQTAIWALGEIGDNSASDAIAAGLSDANPSVRMRAIWALGQIGPKSAPKALVAMLRDPNPQIREVTAWALFQIEDPSAVDELDAALRTETNKNLQMAYIKALAATGEKSVEGVRRLLDSKDPQVRSMAVRALAGGRGAGPWPWPWPQPRPQP